MKRISLVLAFAVASAIPGTALACGGMFCSAWSFTPAPIEQSWEQVVFEIHDDAVTMHVQIEYVGTAQAFAWVVPVSAVPEVTESPITLFEELERETHLQFTIPSDDCSTAQASGFRFEPAGCESGCEDDPNAFRGSLAFLDRVQVKERNFTENYEFVVLEAASTIDLVDWLQFNGYNVSDNMTPGLDAYNHDNANFLAVKLLAGREATDISPIAMTYRNEAGGSLSIPLRLTAVAAQPLMHIQAFVVADRPYVPSNYSNAVPDTDELLVDRGGGTNYAEWVARASSESEGQLWISEFVGEARFRGEERVISRYYTRMSPEFMTLDPVFSPHPDSAYRVSRSIDLSDHAPVGCAEAGSPEPSPCGFNYCGLGSTCVVVDGEAGCVCAAGDVAQVVGGDDGSHVACVPEVNPLGVTAQAGGAGTPVDPCATYECGMGSCVLRSGFPTCLCEADSFASVTPDNQIGCVPIGDSPASFGPGAGSESAPPARVPSGSGTQTSGAVGGLWLPLLFAVAVLFGRRRRSGEKSGLKVL